jgi:hypothetical protein
MITITYEGTAYQFDQKAITVDEWRELKRKYKMTPKAFDEGIGEADPDASTFLYWVMLRQAGDKLAVLGDQLKPDIIALNAALAAAESDEPEEDEAAGPDPTSPSSSRPGSARAPAIPGPPSGSEGAAPGTA